MSTVDRRNMLHGRTLRLWLLLAGAAAAVVPTVTVAASQPASPPAAPSAVVVVGGNRSIAVSWSASTAGQPTFVVTAQGSGRAHTCTTRGLACTVASLTNGAVYDVTVVAKDKAGTSPSSAAASARAGVPSAPRAVRVLPGTATLSVTWSAPVASGASRLTSYMATAMPGGFSCSTSGTILSQEPGRNCVIAGLTSGTAYTVTVTATNAFGTGVPSLGQVASAA